MNWISMGDTHFTIWSLDQWPSPNATCGISGGFWARPESTQNNMVLEVASNPQPNDANRVTGFHWNHVVYRYIPEYPFWREKKNPKKQIWVPQSQISNETPHSWDSHDAATSPVPKGSHYTKRIFIFTSRVWCLWDPTQTTGKQFLHSRNHEAVRSEWSFRILGISCNCRARYFSLVGGSITILKNMKVNEKDDIPYILWNIIKMFQTTKQFMNNRVGIKWCLHSFRFRSLELRDPTWWDMWVCLKMGYPATPGYPCQIPLELSTFLGITHWKNPLELETH